MDTTEETTFEILDFPYFTSQWAKIAKRAQRTGCTIGYEILADDTRQTVCPCDSCAMGVTHNMHPKRTQRVVTVRVWGDTPRFAGYELVAVITDLHEALRQVRGVPGSELPESLWFTDDHCDHCNANVRRNSVIVLRHEDGNLVQVGTSCVKDFLGGHSPADVAWAATWLPELSASLNDEERDGYGAGHEMGWDPASTLRTTAAVVGIRGWVSKGQSTEKLEATAVTVSWLTARRPSNADATQEWDALWTEIAKRDAAADLDTVNGALAWVVNTPANGNDYLMNLKGLVLKSAWTAKDLGLGASIIGSYLREQGKLAERAARETTPATLCPAGRMVVEGTVVQEATKENDFGVRYVMTVLDDRGFKVWGTQPSAILSDIKVGSRVRFTATLEASNRDESFGFFARPTKAEILEAA